MGKLSAVDRFWAKVDRQAEGCWLWTASTTRGYGTLTIDGRHTYAHRFSYELHVGPIPPGLDIDHLCRTPACVNPAHLEPVTHRENLRRGMAPSAKAAREGVCQRGHLFTPENTYIRKDSDRRMCRKCQHMRNLRRLGRLAELEEPA
jgi:hypothetical protein